MSRSDTDADMIDADRPRYQLGRVVSFIHMQYSSDVLVGTVASSRQIIRGQTGAVEITYDILSSGMIFSNIPEENILKTPWPPQQHSRTSTTTTTANRRRS